MSCRSLQRSLWAFESATPSAARAVSSGTASCACRSAAKPAAAAQCVPAKAPGLKQRAACACQAQRGPGTHSQQLAAEEGAVEDAHGSGESRAVNVAIASNIIIFAAKLGVSMFGGSSSLLSEALHTLADIGNQLLLRLGIARSTKAPTQMYPYGYLKEKFVFSLISAVGVFCIGAGASLINGFYAIVDHNHDVGGFLPSFVVLAISFLVEGYSCLVAVREISVAAERRGVTFFEHLDSGADPAAVAVMAEDGAAVAGVTIAAAATLLVRLTDWQDWDGIGSIAVGVLLAFVALFLIQRNRSVLVGRAMNPDDFNTIFEALLRDPVVHHVYDARSEEIGPGVYRFSADLDFHGDEIVARYLARIDAHTLQAKFAKSCGEGRDGDTSAFELLLKEHGARVVQAVGAEVDRMEAEVQKLVPGVQYVDLEADRGRFWLYRASLDGSGDESELERGRSGNFGQLSFDAAAWKRESKRIDSLLMQRPRDAAGNSSTSSGSNSEGGGSVGSAVARSNGSDKGPVSLHVGFDEDGRGGVGQTVTVDSARVSLVDGSVSSTVSSYDEGVYVGGPQTDSNGAADAEQDASGPRGVASKNGRNGARSDEHESNRVHIKQQAPE